MPEFGFSPQPRQAVLASLISNLRSRSDDARIATVTGRHADPTFVLDGRVNELLQIEKSINDLSDYAQIIALSEARTETMQRSLSQIGSIGQALADTTDLLTTNGTDDNFAVVSRQAQDELSTAISALNIDFAGRALFAGDNGGNAALETPSVIQASSVTFLEGAADAASAYAALEAEFMSPGGLFDTTFYRGGAGTAPKTEVAPGEQIDYTVKADEAPFRRYLLNMVVLGAAFDQANAIDPSQRRALMEQASSGLRTSISEITAIEGRLGTAEARIATAKARNIAAEASLTINYNALAGAEPFEAAITLTQLEDQLETAFATTSRLSNLTLANFI